MGAKCAGCFPASKCTYTLEEIGWIEKVDIARETCTDAMFDQCFRESNFCFSRACSADGIMSECAFYIYPRTPGTRVYTSPTSS